MPPRLEALQRLTTVKLCIRPAAASLLPVVQAANLSQRDKKKRKPGQDPYRLAQAQQRKDANLKRREELAKERTDAWGHAVWGAATPTPFAESLNPILKPRINDDGTAAEDAAAERSSLVARFRGLRNFYVSDVELNDAISHSYAMTKPVKGVVQDQLDPEGSHQKQIEEHEANHQRALVALQRITALENGSARDRSRANVQRIISEFGRHETDKVLQPKPPSISPNAEPPVPRAGPDTGSSEVQIAILTAKIRTLAKALEVNRGYRDRHNKNRLRLLVHRRQRLLQYMERKERGSERWTHMIEKLGLTPATWKGEISL